MWPSEMIDSDRCFIGPAMEDEDLSLRVMRQMCDVYVHPLADGLIDGSYTILESGYLDHHGRAVEPALKAFNKAKGTNFKLVKLIKSNAISTIFHCSTFQAKEDGASETFLFRAVVNVAIDDEVLLCEIKDDKEEEDLGKGVLSIVSPYSHYVCFKHELGECYLPDGGGKRYCADDSPPDYASGPRLGYAYPCFKV